MKGIFIFSIYSLIFVQWAFAETIKDPKGSLSREHHTFITPQEIEWQPGPPSLPPGAEISVLKGDMKSPGLFTARLKLPADYRIPLHWHPMDEHVTVLSGAFHMAPGDNFQKERGKKLERGAFAVMPANMHHFAWTTEETIIQLHGQGPWQINYINKSDDPRNPAG